MKNAKVLKNGDKVICIQGDYLFSLKVGNIYTVKKVFDEEFISIYESPEHLRHISRFEIYNRKLKDVLLHI